jgi:MoaA/NifB/PqqE/SkfB family radical SAM enzyme
LPKNKKNKPIASAKKIATKINVGYMCNQVCAHCHVDANLIEEIMTMETMQQILDVLKLPK